MDYKFSKIDLDEYELSYTNKNKEKVKIPFKRTVEMGQKIQGITARARAKMFIELTKLGITKDDLIIKKSDGKGHTTYDETNYQEFERKYIEEETLIVMNEIMESCFKKNLVDLFDDIGINTYSNDKDSINAVSTFSQKFGMIISKNDEEKSPSASDKK